VALKKQRLAYIIFNKKRLASGSGWSSLIAHQSSVITQRRWLMGAQVQHGSSVLKCSAGAGNFILCLCWWCGEFHPLSLLVVRGISSSVFAGDQNQIRDGLVDPRRIDRV
jgi:hypothetical protein